MSEWLPIGSFCIAFVLAFGSNWLTLVPWRRSVGKHWTERARLLYPAQVSAAVRPWPLGLALGGTSYIVDPDSSFLSAGFLGFLGAFLSMYFFTREMFEGLRFWPWLRTVVANFILFSRWHLVLIVVAILEMPLDFGPTTWLIAGGVFSLLLADMCGLGIRLLKLFGILLPADEKLQALVADVSQKMKIRVAGASVLPTFVANAMALFLTRQVVFTDRLLAILSDEQIKAICAHELGHFNDGFMAVSVRMVTLSVLFTFIFARPLVGIGVDADGLVMAVVGGLLLVFGTMIFFKRIARRMEERADKAAFESQFETGAYASALARAYESNQMPAVMPRRSSGAHPDLYDRMLAAGVTPDFLKPLPPERQVASRIGATVVSVATVAIAAGVVMVWSRLAGAMGGAP